MCLLLKYNPINSIFSNYIEKVNTLAIYLSSYLMLIFTPWIPDIDLKYDIGSNYSTFLWAITAINLLGIIHEQFKSI